MTVYLKREDIPKTCGECRFRSGNVHDMCILWDNGPGHVVWEPDEKKEGCPIRCVDELGASSKIVVTADGITCRIFDPQLIVKKRSADFSALRAAAKQELDRWRHRRESYDPVVNEHRMRKIVQIDALLELLEACGVGGKAHGKG